MAQTGRSNVRYVDPQRRYTVVLGPSWNAPFGALPHDDRAGTHDSADGRCGSYVSIGCGQAALWITSKKFCGFAAMRDSRRLLTAAGQRVAETLSERGELSGDEVDALLARPSRSLPPSSVMNSRRLTLSMPLRSLLWRP